MVEVGCIKHRHLSLRLVICGKILYNLVIGPFGDIMTRTLPKLFLVFFLSVGTPERDIFLEKARI